MIPSAFNTELNKINSTSIGATYLINTIYSFLLLNFWSGFSIHGMSILDFFDFISNSVLMPIVAFLTCVFVGFIVKPETITDEVESSTQKFKSKKNRSRFQIQEKTELPSTPYKRLHRP